MSRARPVCRWIYRRLLLAYSPSFRAQFGAEATQVFLDRFEEAARGGWVGLGDFWLRIGLDIAATAPPDRLNALGALIMKRALTRLIASLAAGPACLFWLAAIGLSLAVKLGLTHDQLGAWLGAVLPSLNAQGGAYQPLVARGLMALVVLGPVLSLVLLAASKAAIWSPDRPLADRPRSNLQAVTTVDMGLGAAAFASALLGLAWLVAHLALGS